jgi:hypothetical protein
MEIRPLLAVAIGVVLALPVQAQETQDRPNAVKARRAPSPISVGVDYSRPRPIGLRSDWLSNADYPPESWRNGEEGDVNYYLAVDSAGMVTSCDVEGSASAALKAETCRLMRERARFEPARDDKGKAIAATYAGYHVWSRREPDFGSSSFTMKVGFTLDERGRSSNCRMIEQSGDIPPEMLRAFQKNPCPNKGSDKPPRDAEGRPVARDFVMTVDVDSTLAASAPVED